MEFNIEEESKKLKELVSKYSSDSFIGDIAQLLTLIEPPRMPIYPFQGLDSPYRQLTYLAALNLSSSLDKVASEGVKTNDEWKEIVVQSIRTRAGYYDELLPNEDDDAEEFYKFYKISMPVFNNYFDTGNLNFEEQEIEKIETIFKPFNEVIEQTTNLSIDDFIKIYNLIDQELEYKVNYPIKVVRESSEAKEFWDQQLQNDISLLDWTYDGDNEDIKGLVNHFTNRGVKNTVNKSNLYPHYDNEKINTFFQLFSVKREEDQGFLFYTQPNKVLLNPLYRKNEDEFIVIDTKQIINSVYRKLHGILSDSEKREPYFKFRGNWLQNKTEQILRTYFKDSAYIYNEFKVNGKAHDVLLLYKHLALIIENKAHREVQFSGVPDTLNIYKQYFSRFKKSIRDGYEQAWRLKDLFYYEDKFLITDLKNNPLYEVPTRKYSNVFSIIITLDKFREPQINTNSLIDLHEDDDYYPLSISIDDFEVLMLTLKKKKIGIGKFIKLLELRQQLQGRLNSNDELEIWGAFINVKKFEIPEDEKLHFNTEPFMTEVFDECYEKGLGFDNEKNIDKKRSGKYLIINSIARRNK